MGFGKLFSLALGLAVYTQAALSLYIAPEELAEPASISNITARQSSGYTDYAFVYFTGEGTSNGEQIYVSVSNNNSPRSWTQAKGGQPFLTSNVGTKGVRDPSIIRSQDGSKFWIIATDLRVYGNGNYDTENGSKAIVVWESSDLKTWSSPRLPVISPSNAGMTWAPDAIWDPAVGQYLVYWTCNLKGEGWFIMKSYTSDFKTFSTAQKWLTGAGMDTTIARDRSNGKYYLMAKNGPNELIRQSVSTTLGSSWTKVSEQIGSGTIPKGEGPLFFQDNADPNIWHMFIDDYSRGRGYVPFDTYYIPSGTWTAGSGYNLPPKSRHGYVIGITAQQRANILAA